jgi:TonB family protein
MKLGPLIVALALMLGPLRLSSQRSGQLLTDARDQIRAQNLDSAITLLQVLTTPGQADSSARAEAFVWLGVATFYKGQDSLAGYDFKAALDNNPLLTPAAVLARLDSGLAALWERQQTTVLCGEALPAWLDDFGPTVASLNSDARAAHRPEVISGPTVSYPDNLRRADVQGRVMVRALIDTLGRAERGSVRIISTPHRDFNGPVTEYMERAHSRAAVSSAGRVRSCIILPIVFSIKH